VSPPGIIAYAGYVPMLRIARACIADAMAWANPSLRQRGVGERSFCNWDEDSITMAVEAARSCLAGQDRDDITGLSLASTTLPFADRDNAVIVAAALGLDESVRCSNLTSSQRAATSALGALAEGMQTGSRQLLTAADRRLAKPASDAEMSFGHGAACVLLGSDNTVADLVGSETLNRDLVDHYRASGDSFDYGFEQRWVRDEGYLKLIPKLVAKVLDKTGISIDEIDHVVFPCSTAVAAKLAATMGISPDCVSNNLAASCGDTGAAHPLLMLCDVLDRATPGQTVLLVGFGQGADAFVLRTTDRVAGNRGALTASLARRREEPNYNRFLSLCGLLETDWGHRAEHDKRTAMPTAYRKRDALASFAGGKCGACGAIQFPLTPVCVNPDCRKAHTQQPFSFADQPARVKTFTEDWLGFSPSPPSIYGNVAFDGGANILMEFADTCPGELEVGMPLSMHFRIKDIDERRHFRRYFWKPAPLRGVT
jgi:hydroxymethylglutaryl-CoA synthase